MSFVLVKNSALVKFEILLFTEETTNNSANN